MDKLHVGICGLGFMGQTHFTRLHNHPRAEVVAVCDRAPARRAGDWSGTPGNLELTACVSRDALRAAAAYDDPAALLADPRIEAVVIALPTALHAPLAVAALEAGKHVLCEKPMALTVGDCDRMLAAARAAGRTLMVAHCIRFWPQYELVKRYVDEGRLGSLRFVSLRRLTSPPSYSSDGWLHDPTQSGGALLDLHIHDIDFAQHLLGLPDAIGAVGSRGVSGALEHVVATYRYTDDRYALLEGGWALTAPRPFEMAIAVHGDRGTLEWSSTWGNDVRFHDGSRTHLLPGTGDAYAQEDDYFVTCVLESRAVERCPPAASRVSVALAWLEERAITTRRVVPLSARLHAAWSA